MSSRTRFASVDVHGTSTHVHRLVASALAERVEEPDRVLAPVACEVAGRAVIVRRAFALDREVGALIGVLISVTTIPAAANVGVAAAYRDWAEFGGAASQLGINLIAIVLAGITTLGVQRAFYVRRRGAAQPAR